MKSTGTIPVRLWIIQDQLTLTRPINSILRRAKSIPHRYHYASSAQGADQQQIGEFSAEFAVELVVEQGHDRTNDQNGYATVIQSEWQSPMRERERERETKFFRPTCRRIWRTSANDNRRCDTASNTVNIESLRERTLRRWASSRDELHWRAAWESRWRWR